MQNESRPFRNQQPVELIPDSPYESRHQFVAELAYKLWVQRGRPLGSPNVDWVAAEHALYESLLESGMITASPTDSQNIGEKLYHRTQSNLEW